MEGQCELFLWACIILTACGKKLFLSLVVLALILLCDGVFAAIHKRAGETQQVTQHLEEVKGDLRFGPEPIDLGSVDCPLCADFRFIATTLWSMAVMYNDLVKQAYWSVLRTTRLVGFLGHCQGPRDGTLPASLASCPTRSQPVCRGLNRSSPRRGKSEPDSTLTRGSPLPGTVPSLPSPWVGAVTPFSLGRCRHSPLPGTVPSLPSPWDGAVTPFSLGRCRHSPLPGTVPSLPSPWDGAVTPFSLGRCRHSLLPGRCCHSPLPGTVPSLPSPWDGTVTPLSLGRCRHSLLPGTVPSLPSPWDGAVTPLSLGRCRHSLLPGTVPSLPSPWDGAVTPFSLGRCCHSPLPGSVPSLPSPWVGAVTPLSLGRCRNSPLPGTVPSLPSPWDGAGCRRDWSGRRGSSLAAVAMNLRPGHEALPAASVPSGGSAPRRGPGWTKRRPLRLGLVPAFGMKSRRPGCGSYKLSHSKQFQILLLCGLLATVSSVKCGTCEPYLDAAGTYHFGFHCPRLNDERRQSYCCRQSNQTLKYCCSKSEFQSMMRINQTVAARSPIDYGLMAAVVLYSVGVTALLLTDLLHYCLANRHRIRLCPSSASLCGDHRSSSEVWVPTPGQESTLGQEASPHPC
ncbi:uncharacterized protein [Narcine bancroftii]|uniref:uncharacterized protein n=1 Tax=Narcine bancroftii TaxID=1343680 RepID=UPI0038312C36